MALPTSSRGDIRTRGWEQGDEFGLVVLVAQARARLNARNSSISAAKEDRYTTSGELGKFGADGVCIRQWHCLLIIGVAVRDDLRYKVLLENVVEPGQIPEVPGVLGIMPFQLLMYKLTAHSHLSARERQV